ncbi:hypothetical protein [Vibrio phage vB_pir03]|nr:hypothetical protein [Vibrio phage vB_pir03]
MANDIVNLKQPILKHQFELEITLHTLLLADLHESDFVHMATIPAGFFSPDAHPIKELTRILGNQSIPIKDMASILSDVETAYGWRAAVDQAGNTLLSFAFTKEARDKMRRHMGARPLSFVLNAQLESRHRLLALEGDKEALVEHVGYVASDLIKKPVLSWVAK